MVINSAIIILLLATVVSSDYNTSFYYRPARSKRQSNEDCFIPTIKNGKFIVLSHNYTQGTPIPNYASVKFFCDEHHALLPNKKLITCDEGSWSEPIPQCKQTCPPLTSTSVDIECSFNNKTVNCSKPVLDGTIARCKCKEFYVSVNTYQFPTTKCNRGAWDKLLIECVPECGEGVSKGVTKVVNGTSAKFGEFPWHIALYHFEEDKHVYKCGGSIINPLIIITAAHCFTDEFGEKYPAEMYYVGAGKYYSAFDAPKDNLAQIRQVKEYYIPPYYKGFNTNYQADLAILVLKREFQLTSVVRPVCVDWNREFERQQLLSNAIGSVVGWGYVDPNKSEISADLKKLTAPFIEISKCLAVVPEEFTRWVTPDKFCAGFTTGSSVCQGDSGGGMVFPWTVNNKLKYYLRGIVSVGPVDMDVCDSHQYGVYTLITHYSDFLQDVIANNSDVMTQAYVTASYGSCQIPGLENGKFLYLDKEYNEGYHIPNYSYLRIHCNENYVLYPEMPYINCINAMWHIPLPKCKKTCLPLISDLANVSCSVDSKTLDCSKSVVDGTIARIICKNGSILFTKCSAGAWSERGPFKICEQELINATTETSTTVLPPLDISSCLAPKIKNGIYEELGPNSGSFIPNYSIVKIICNKNYTSFPSTKFLFCIDGAWNAKVPECKPTCSPRISSTVNIRCTVDDIPVDCSKPLIEGTIAKSSCKEFYEQIQLTQSTVSICIGGTWDNPLPQCEPECGRVPIKSVPLLGGQSTKIVDFPWHIGLYRVQNGENNLLCGGSIISPSVIITAAHCFSPTPRVLNPANEYYVGAGKYFKAYNVSIDLLAQLRQVKEYFIPPLYRGYEGNFQADLAVVIVAIPFEMTSAVQPICVDWNGQLEREQLKPGAEGKLAGWGSEAGKGLEKTIAPYLKTEECFKKIPQNYLRWITPDKFCAGFARGTTVCPGYSGSGLVFFWNSFRPYIIRGIASVVPVENRGCGNGDAQFILYTRVSYYTDWIQDVIAKNFMQH